jgi:hypothetical protein
MTSSPSSGRTAGRRRWRRPCVALVGSWWPAAASPCRRSWPPSTRSKPPTDWREPLCLDCFAASSAPPPSPARPPLSATASPAGRPSVGSNRGPIPTASRSPPSRSRPQRAQLRPPSGTRARSHPAAQGSGGAQGAGGAHRGGVRGPEGQDPQHLSPSLPSSTSDDRSSAEVAGPARGERSMRICQRQRLVTPGVAPSHLASPRPLS